MYISDIRKLIEKKWFKTELETVKDYVILKFTSKKDVGFLFFDVQGNFSDLEDFARID